MASQETKKKFNKLSPKIVRALNVELLRKRRSETASLIFSPSKNVKIKTNDNKTKTRDHLHIHTYIKAQIKLESDDLKGRNVEKNFHL